MAHIALFLGTVGGWFVLIIIILKILCDRQKELLLIREIKTELESVKAEIKLLK
jgi:hypothetical protein